MTGRYRISRKRVSLGHRIGEFLGWAIPAVAAIVAVSLFYRYFLKVRVEAIVVKFLSIDTVLLSYILFYIFVIGGFILATIIYWVGWDNLKSRLKQRPYRSLSVVKDYYRRQKKIRYDSVIGNLDRFSDGKLDLSGKEQDERALANLEEEGVRLAAGNIAFKNGKLDGYFVSYYSNGRVESEIIYKEGKIDGPFHAFYSDGKLHAEKFFREGKLEGIFRAWDEDGSLFFEINYKDGKQDGPDKSYFRSGLLQFLDTYTDGRLINRKTYDEFGNLKYEEDF